MAFFFDHLEEYLLIILFPIMTVVVFIATMVRYFELGSIPWSEELARYIMVWMAYIGVSLGIKKNAHLGVEVIVNMFPPALRKMVHYLRAVVIIVFNVLIIHFSLKIMKHQINIGQTSPALFMPIWIAYLAVPAGLCLMGIRVIQSLLPRKKTL